ncbi:conserved hypothetical protein [Vibrio crassostreae]|uniref:hypothetical protein n=1 Tax=Vibrio TaxID=662 RepID=UPI0010513C96|nr:hypothetical protein [Vibrio crassostreae]TCT63946.1 hypothetical protein EDB40_101443 [Vibrio crassostreae]CAK3178861.1 conserved hypothetical protein [Vibrio crassostreae]CAK3190055.1 conserved hypothetical protein [Vibrio crassostreae]CAK4029270.1 conserved hypothetical protein [Vibrio crassostreae]
MKSVQMNDVEKKAKSNCSHSSLSKEYHLGSATGDYICDDCRKAGFGRNWPKHEAKEQKS